MTDRDDTPFAGLPMDDREFRVALTDLVRLVDRGDCLSRLSSVDAVCRVVRCLRTHPQIAAALGVGGPEEPDERSAQQGPRDTSGLRGTGLGRQLGQLLHLVWAFNIKTGPSCKDLDGFLHGAADQLVHAPFLHEPRIHIDFPTWNDRRRFSEIANSDNELDTSEWVIEKREEGGPLYVVFPLRQVPDLIEALRRNTAGTEPG